jgi:hypothetical protein
VTASRANCAKALPPRPRRSPLYEPQAELVRVGSTATVAETSVHGLALMVSDAMRRVKLAEGTKL